MEEVKIVMYWSHGGEAQTTTEDGHTYTTHDGGVLDTGVDREGNEHPVKEEHVPFLQQNGFTFSGDGQNQPPPIGEAAPSPAPVAGETEEATVPDNTVPAPTTDTTAVAPDATRVPTPDAIATDGTGATAAEAPVPGPSTAPSSVETTAPASAPDEPVQTTAPDEGATAVAPSELAPTPLPDVADATTGTAEVPTADATAGGNQAPDAGQEAGQQTIGTLSAAAETTDPSTANQWDMSTQASNVPPSEAPASPAEETPNG